MVGTSTSESSLDPDSVRATHCRRRARSDAFGLRFENAAQVHVDATVDEPGRALVSGRLLADIARSPPNQPVVFLPPKAAALNFNVAARRSFSPLLPADEYPTLLTMPDPVGSVSGDLFAAGFTSRDRSRTR